MTKTYNMNAADRKAIDDLYATGFNMSQFDDLLGQINKANGITLEQIQDEKHKTDNTRMMLREERGKRDLRGAMKRIAEGLAMKRIAEGLALKRTAEEQTNEHKRKWYDMRDQQGLTFKEEFPQFVSTPDLPNELSGWQKFCRADPSVTKRMKWQGKEKKV